MTSNGILAVILGTALSGLAATGASTAAELTEGSGHSLRLGAYDGVLYYTVDQLDFRVVATVASDPDETPIRFVSSLRDGQKMIVSVPRAAGQPPVEVEIVRNGDIVRVDEDIVSYTVELVDEALISEAQ